MRIQIASDQEHDEVFAEIIDDQLSERMGPEWGNYGTWSRVTHEQGQWYFEVFIRPGESLKFELDEVIEVLRKAKASLGG